MQPHRGLSFTYEFGKGGNYSVHRTFRMRGVGQVGGSQGRKGTPEKYAHEHRALGRYSMLNKWMRPAG